MIIPLNTTKYKNQNILIDDEDYDKFKKYTWTLYSTPRHNSIYVVATYAAINNYESVRLHRLIMNAKSGEIVDHINGNALDNRKCNLRVTSASGNNKNAKKRKNAVGSLYKGVSKVKRKHNTIMWIVQIQANKIHYRFGPFTTELEAAKAYNEAAIKYFGEFAHLNTIPEVA